MNQQQIQDAIASAPNGDRLLERMALGLPSGFPMVEGKMVPWMRWLGIQLAPIIHAAGSGDGDRTSAEAWSAAWAKWTSARDTYHDAPIDIAEEADARLHRTYSDAFNDLMKVPAPTVLEVATKLKTARQRWSDFEMPDEVLDALEADLRRLAEVGR